MSLINYRKAYPEDYEQIIRLVDSVFFAHDSAGFRGLLPNLYLDPLVTTRAAFLACDGENIIGHVGVYRIWLKIGLGAGRSFLLKAGGVGAVATAASYRGKAIMSNLLLQAIEFMKTEKYDVSVLWGDRMRYARFGYEPAGRVVEWRFEERMARTQGLKPAALCEISRDRDLRRIVEVWNSDSVGTKQTQKSLAALMLRKKWNFMFVDQPATSGPASLVCYQQNNERITVDKLIAPDSSMAAGILLALRERVDREKGSVSLRCPAGSHPVSDLALQFGRDFSLRTAGQFLVLNTERIAASLGVTELNLAAGNPGEVARALFGHPVERWSNDVQVWIEAIAHV